MKLLIRGLKIIFFFVFLLSLFLCLCSVTVIGAENGFNKLISNSSLLLLFRTNALVKSNNIFLLLQAVSEITEGPLTLPGSYSRGIITLNSKPWRRQQVSSLSFPSRPGDS